MKKKAPLFLSLALTLTTLVNGVYAVDEYESQPVYSSPSAYSSPSLRGEVVSISAGSYGKGQIDRGISSETARVGDRGYLTLSENLKGIPAGSRVEFTVSMVDSASRLKFRSPGRMQLKAVSITSPNGQTTPLSGDVYVVSQPSETVLVGSSKKERALKTGRDAAIGAGVGALGGLIGSSLGRGSRKGKATAIGTGIGAGAGLATAAFAKGEEVFVNSGDTLFLKFANSTQVNLR